MSVVYQQGLRALGLTGIKRWPTALATVC